MSGSARIALIGAGLVGRRHAGAIAASPAATLAAIADPDPAAVVFAASAGVPHFATLAELIVGAAPDGVLLATPNAHHAAGAREAVAAGLPVLVEKPLVDDIAEGRALLAAAERAGVPVLCGHHRRHNPLVAAAHRAIAAGDLGRIVALHAHAWLMKPDDYFTPWRRAPGAGPVMINLIHDIDLVRHFAGDIVEVEAMTAHGRGFAVEDTAVVLLRFASGALGTLTVSDTIAAPWSWELTAGENPAYPRTDAPALTVGGTHGALEIPAAALWHYRGERSWWAPIARTSLVCGRHVDPLVAQIDNFAAVIAGEAAPLVTGADGLKALAVVDAIHRAARSRQAEVPAV
ncbi:MAG: Gfo/Idh/MocA family oxidoreductase [Acuticoccus sp.]